MAGFAGKLRGDGGAIANYYDSSYPDRNARKDIAAVTLFVEGVAARIQQVQGPDGCIWHVVAEGRLYGRGRLTGVLSRPETAGDEELLAAAFSRWGEEFPARIDGTYAFMAWNPIAGILLLVRDPVGGLPIFYHKGTGGFAFATDLPALLALPTVSRQLRLEMLAGLLERAPGLTGSGSFHQDVELLPAGHLLRLENGEVSVRRWWRPPPVRVREQPAADLRHLITTAVEERVRGGRQCAVLLSGGLDSSAIACLAARRLRQEGRRLLAISAVLPDGWSGPEADERRHIEAVLAQEDNIDVHWVREGPETHPFGALSLYFDLLHYPPYSTVTHMEAALAAAGKTHGVDVVLSGFGGDFFASSRPNHYPLALLCEGEWHRALRELIAMRQIRAGWPALVREELLGPLWRAFQPLFQKPAIAGPLLRPLLRGQRRRLGPTVATIRRKMAFLLEPGRIELTLNSATQVFAKAFGQTLLFPLLDRRLLEFMLSLPARQIRPDGMPRSLFRQAMVGILPETVRLRPDKGPAFDPMLAARLSAARGDLAAWADATAGHPSWDVVNRQNFLTELSRISPTNREGWRQGMFTSVLQGGVAARFVQWHSQKMGTP